MRQVTKDVLIFLAGFVVVLVASAFLAPWLYSFLPFKFDRILRRLIMIGTVILTIGLVRSRRESLGRLGLEWGPLGRRLAGYGFLLGILLVVLITAAQWGMGARFWRVHETDLGHWIGLFFKGFAGGLAIGVIEEFFFRGFLFLTFRDLWNVRGSLVMTNFIYAVVHFFPKGRPLLGPEPTVTDSFRILGAFGLTFWERPETLVPLAGLFLFGLLLSFAFLRTNSLFLPIGVHSGCVFALKMNRRFLPDISEKMNFLSGTKNLYDGIVGLGILAVLTVIMGIRAGVRQPGKASSVRPGWKAACFSAALLLVFSTVSFAVPPVKKRAKDAPKVVYSFVDHFSKTRALRASEEATYEGEWKEDRFIFEELSGPADIVADRKALVEKKPRPVILFPSGPGLESSLAFPEVPPGRRLRFFYILSANWAVEEDKLLPVLIEIWLGRKRLLRTEVSTAGWKEKTLDLMLPFLLQRKYRLTIRTRSLGEEWRNLIFYGYVE